MKSYGGPAVKAHGWMGVRVPCPPLTRFIGFNPNIA